MLCQEKSAALKEVCDKLLVNALIKESFYLYWVANPVLVKKPNGKWKACNDYSILNDVYPKDCFPLLRINQLVDITIGHELLSIMDTYSEYNQITLQVPNQKNMTSSQI